MPPYLGSKEVWQEKIKYYVSTPLYRNLFDFADEPVEFDWRILQTFQLLDEIKALMENELKSGAAPVQRPNHLHVNVQRH